MINIALAVTIGYLLTTLFCTSALISACIVSSRQGK
jgi:hypothetical protein